MKRTDLEKNRGLKINDKLAKSTAPSRFGADSAAIPDRREQRRLDQAAGLVPFAVKLPGDLVKKLQAMATERNVPIGDLVAALLAKQFD
ncbi:hypothetical protein [Chitinivorax sp. B]|uniref:hypothetical protein n=1 Tax=Chitinivorax sp. B TaxID=2502235 RepID=UPI0010F4EACD|nr:hypothetical protein [Chitinivorax sp. B]